MSTLLFWQVAPLLAASVPQTLFVFQYGLRHLGAGQWWRDEVGRALFLKAAALAMVLDLFVAQVAVDRPGLSFAAPSDGFPRAVTVAYWLIFLAVTYQYAALIRSRRHDRGRWM